MKKYGSFLLAVCLTAALLSGCGREKPTAADSVKAIYDLYILRDFSGVSKLGMTEEEVDDALNAYDGALAETIRSNFSASGLEIEDETIEEICQARIDALAKMKATAAVTSEEGAQAVVTLSTTYFDEVELDTDAAYAAREAADAAGFTDYDEYLDFLMENYTQNLIDGYHAVIPSEDTKDITVECTIIDNTWLPEDMASFGSQLGAVVAGQ